MRIATVALAFSLFTIGLTPSCAQAFGKKTGPESGVDVEALSIGEIKMAKSDALTPGHLVEFKIKLDLMPGFHAYVEQYKLTLTKPEKFEIKEWQVQPQVQFNDPISKKTKWGTEGSSQLTTWVVIPSHAKAGEHELHFDLVYQACGKDFCLFPKTVSFSQVITVAAMPGSDLMTVDMSDPLADALEKGWLYALLVVFIAGVLTSFTPCIFPMIPITLAILGSSDKTRTRRTRFFMSLTYVLGIATTYSVLGLIVARTGALFGALLGQPLVVGFIALIFVLMGLSMFGLFEIQMPAFITRQFATDSGTSKKNFVHAFSSGLIAGVVASPCVGPVLISILTYVAQAQNAVFGFVLLFTFALGLGQIFLVLGTFNNVLQKLPRSGPWMEKVKYVFGTIMILMALYYLYPIRKALVPEKWHDKIFAQESNQAAGVPWVQYSDERLAQAIAEKQPVILDFQAEWCLACKELEHYTFSEPRVKELGQKFLWMAFDATSPSPELEALQKKYSIGGLPFVLFYNTRGEYDETITLKGFEKADAFLKRMQQALQPN